MTEKLGGARVDLHREVAERESRPEEQSPEEEDEIGLGKQHVWMSNKLRLLGLVAFGMAVATRAPWAMRCATLREGGGGRGFDGAFAHG